MITAIPKEVTRAPTIMAVEVLESAPESGELEPEGVENSVTVAVAGLAVPAGVAELPASTVVESKGQSSLPSIFRICR